MECCGFSKGLYSHIYIYMYIYRGYFSSARLLCGVVFWVPTYGSAAYSVRDHRMYHTYILHMYLSSLCLCISISIWVWAYLPSLYIYICKRPIYKSTVNISRRQREGPLCSVYALSPAGPCVDLNTYIFIYIYIYIYIYRSCS